MSPAKKAAQGLGAGGSSFTPGGENERSKPPRPKLPCGAESDLSKKSSKFTIQGKKSHDLVDTLAAKAELVSDALERDAL